MKTDYTNNRQREALGLDPHEPTPSPSTVDFEREADELYPYHSDLDTKLIYNYVQESKRKAYIKGRQTTSQEGLRELVEWKSLKEELPVDAFLCWVKRIDGSIYIGFRSNKPLSENPDPSKDCYWTGDKYGSFDLRFMDGVHFHCHFSDLTVIEWAYILPPKANEILNSKTINMKKVKTIKVPPTMSAHEANKLYGDRYGVDWEYE